MCHCVVLVVELASIVPLFVLLFVLPFMLVSITPASVVLLFVLPFTFTLPSFMWAFVLPFALPSVVRAFVLPFMLPSVVLPFVLASGVLALLLAFMQPSIVLAFMLVTVACWHLRWHPSYWCSCWRSHHCCSSIARSAFMSPLAQL